MKRFDRRAVPLAVAALVAGALAAPLVLRVRSASGAGHSDSAIQSAVVSAASPAAGENFADPLPGAPPFSPELTEKLQARWAARDSSYKPRTRHLRPDGSPKYTNRLFLESSPYLRQYARACNPRPAVVRA